MNPIILFCALSIPCVFGQRGGSSTNSFRAQLRNLRRDFEQLKNSRQVHIHVGGGVVESETRAGHLHIHIDGSGAQSMRHMHHMHDETVYGLCHLDASSNSEGLSGGIYLRQEGNQDMEVHVMLSGFDPDKGHSHGMHIHDYGILQDGCSMIGGHFDPHNASHSVGERPVGDLQNIACDDNGDVSTSFTDPIAKLLGPNNVVGRSIAIHAADHGGVLACCIIGYSSAQAWDTMEQQMSHASHSNHGSHANHGHSGGHSHHGGHVRA